jgi:hypothetical protein
MGSKLSSPIKVASTHITPMVIEIFQAKMAFWQRSTDAASSSILSSNPGFRRGAPHLPLGSPLPTNRHFGLATTIQSSTQCGGNFD